MEKRVNPIGLWTWTIKCRFPPKKIHNQLKSCFLYIEKGKWMKIDFSKIYWLCVFCHTRSRLTSFLSPFNFPFEAFKMYFSLNGSILYLIDFDYLIAGNIDGIFFSIWVCLEAFHLLLIINCGKIDGIIVFYWVG